MCTAGDSSAASDRPVITRTRVADDHDGDLVTEIETPPTAGRTGDPPVRTAALALVATAVLGLLVRADGPTGIRLVLALVAVMFTPGIAIVGLLGLPRSAARGAFVVAVSLSVGAVVSEALLLTDRLTARNGAFALLVVSTPFVIAQGVVWRRRRPSLAPVELPRIRLAWEANMRTPLVLTGVAAVCWFVAALTVEPRRAGELGMISAFPAVWWVGLAALTAAFLLHLRRGTWPLLAAVQLGGLMAFLYVVMTVSEPYSRIPTSYTHVGLIDYLVRDHRIVSYFDARFSWPGSLSLGAMLTQLSGATSSVAFVKWAIPAFVAMWALAVYAVARAYSSTERVPWLTVWVFLTLNWVGQDYWSSQALNFFLVVTVIAAVATWFPRRILRARTRYLPFEQPPHAFTTSAQGLGLVLGIVLISVAVASSHQLSPFTLVGMLAALWLIDRRDIRLLPVLVAVITLTWISWGADDYWIGHFRRLTQDVGQVSGVVSKGTVGRIGEGSFGRRLVLATRLGLSLSAWAAAGGSLLYALRRGRTTMLTLGVLAAVPIGAVALQSYGGELGLRIFLFSLPFAALLIANGLDAALVLRWRRPALALVALVAIVLLATSGFVVARYGNEEFEQTYREDVAVTKAFYDNAPADSYVFGSNTSNPFRMLPYHDYRPRKDEDFAHPDQIPTGKALRATGATDGFIIIYESAIKESYLRQGAPRGWNRVVDQNLRELGARALFRDGRAVLYRYSIPKADPVPVAPVVKLPYVSERVRDLLGQPALAAAILVSLLLLLSAALHVTAVRWRPGWLEGVALATAVAVVIVVYARFEILT